MAFVGTEALAIACASMSRSSEGASLDLLDVLAGGVSVTWLVCLLIAADRSASRRWSTCWYARLRSRRKVSLKTKRNKRRFRPAKMARNQNVARQSKNCVSLKWSQYLRVDEITLSLHATQDRPDGRTARGPVSLFGTYDVLHSPKQRCGVIHSYHCPSLGGLIYVRKRGGTNRHHCARTDA